MPKGQFYALAIFVMGRLDTKGVGLKLWGRRRACSQDYPIALDPLLLGEHKHDHDFLFSFPFENAKAITVPTDMKKHHRRFGKIGRTLF